MSTVSACPTRPRIVCIDDDPAVLTALVTRFRRYDVEVLPAYNGAHGVWLAVTEKPSLIVTDLRMPSGDGNHVLEYLKNRPDTSAIPVIVMTGVKDSETRRWLMTRGAAAYLYKPASFEELLTAINRQVAIRPMRAG